VFSSSLFSHQFAVNCQHSSHWNNAKFAKLEKTMLCSQTFKVSNPYSPCLGLWDLKIGSGFKSNGVRRKPCQLFTDELELGLTTACRLGPLLCFPKNKIKNKIKFKLLSWIYSPYHGSGTKGVLGYSTPWVMARGNGPWPFPRIKDEGLPWWVRRSEKLKSIEGLGEGQARGASTVEDSGRKQTKNPAFCQCMTNKGNGHMYSFAMRTRK
jgi:hypothetical protein